MTKAPAQHMPMTQFPVVDNILHVGGMPLDQLARRVGQTPFYAYDRSVISKRVADLRQCLPNDVHLHYAIKANPMRAVVQHLAGLTDGLDVASLREMRWALDTGVEPQNISFAGPGKQDVELRAAAAAGVIVNLESAAEMERLAAICLTDGVRARVSVRVNPDFELKASGMKMAGGPKPFGVDAEQVPAMLNRMGELTSALDFQGFHIFSGSQNLKPESLIEAQTKTFELALQLAEHAPGPIRWLNIGGGFGIPYFPGEQHLDLAPVAENLTKLLETHRPALPDTEIVIELGRYLVGEAGVYVSKVVDVKTSRGQTFAVSDGGLHHHLSNSGNFGQVIRKNYPACIGNRVCGDDTSAISVVGPLCTPLDILADKYALPSVQVNDLVVIFQSGAYGYSASPHLFLGHAEPVEVLV